jgi:hypothetical protein
MPVLASTNHGGRHRTGGDARTRWCRSTGERRNSTHLTAITLAQDIFNGSIHFGI